MSLLAKSMGMHLQLVMVLRFWNITVISTKPLEGLKLAELSKDSQSSLA